MQSAQFSSSRHCQLLAFPRRQETGSIELILNFALAYIDIIYLQPILCDAVKKGDGLSTNNVFV